MDRRGLLKTMTAGVGLASGLVTTSAGAAASTSAADIVQAGDAGAGETDREIPVAFLLSDTAVVIDFAGPWEVFQDTVIPGRSRPNPFSLFTVAETLRPIKASGGMTILPEYTIATAPAPQVLIIPAQADPSPQIIAWIRHVARSADLTASICTGAFLLAKTGLLAGKPATTHHGAFAEFAIDFPDVQVRRGARFVDNGTTATSGGLSAGIDLALHIVERYFGRQVATATADTMEYQGRGWMDANSNQVYARQRTSTATHPICAVCEMDVAVATAPASVYRGHRYLFCGEPHKALFDSNPARFLNG